MKGEMNNPPEDPLQGSRLHPGYRGSQAGVIHSQSSVPCLSGLTLNPADRLSKHEEGKQLDAWKLWTVVILAFLLLRGLNSMAGSDGWPNRSFRSSIVGKPSRSRARWYVFLNFTLAGGHASLHGSLPNSADFHDCGRLCEQFRPPSIWASPNLFLVSLARTLGSGN